MIRLFLFIVIFIIFLGFIVLNLYNTSDISFGFTEFKNIPVFVSVLCSFMLGMLFAIPLSFSLRRKKNNAQKLNKKQGKSSEGEVSAIDEITKEKSPYGID